MYNHVPACFDWCVGVFQVLRLQQRTVPPPTPHTPPGCVHQHTMLRTLTHCPRGTLYMYNHVSACFDWCVGVLQVLRIQRAVPPGTLAAFVEENE